jgi:hypothetical protein
MSHRDLTPPAPAREPSFTAHTRTFSGRASNIHRSLVSLKIPPDSASHKLYYVNYKISRVSAPVDGLWINAVPLLPSVCSYGFAAAAEFF